MTGKFAPPFPQYELIYPRREGNFVRTIKHYIHIEILTAVKTYLLFLMMTGFSLVLAAQNIAISDEAGYVADPSAMLDVRSLSKGLLIPRMTATERDSIDAPAKGLMIYQTDREEGFYYNNGTSEVPDWVNLTTATNNHWKRDSVDQKTTLSNSDDNVGIGTDNPGAKLSVNGMIEAMNTGFKFPDGSLQGTAAYSPGPQGAADGRWVIGLYILNVSGSWDSLDCQGCCKVMDFAWDMNPAGQGGGGIVFDDITFTKNIDKASITFIQRMLLGQNLQRIIFNFYWVQANSESYTKYYTLELQNIGIKDVKQKEIHVGNGRYAHLEDITLDINSINAEIIWDWLPDNLRYVWHNTF
jgi:type VI secretion system Hcp family effector